MKWKEEFRNSFQAEKAAVNKTHLSISRPGQRSALRRLSLAVGGDDVLPQLINNDLALQILLREDSQLCNSTMIMLYPLGPAVLRNSLFIIIDLQKALNFHH